MVISGIQWEQAGGWFLHASAFSLCCLPCLCLLPLVAGASHHACHTTHTALLLQHNALPGVLVSMVGTGVQAGTGHSHHATYLLPARFLDILTLPGGI